MSTYYETPTQLVKEDKKVLEEAPTYRVSQLFVHLGWVDLDFECPILLRQMEFPFGTIGLARWRNISNLSQPDPAPQPYGSPCTTDRNTRCRESSFL